MRIGEDGIGAEWGSPSSTAPDIAIYARGRRMLDNGGQLTGLVTVNICSGQNVARTGKMTLRGKETPT